MEYISQPKKGTKPPPLLSNYIRQKLQKKNLEQRRIEHRTFRMQSEHSTTELQPRSLHLKRLNTSYFALFDLANSFFEIYL